MDVQIINLTPHVLNIYDRRHVAREGMSYKPICFCEGLPSQPVVSVPSSGFARAREVTTTATCVHVDGNCIEVTRKVIEKSVTGLPEPQEGTIYVVSYITAQAVPDRKDVFFPGDPVRDDEGNLIGCAGLSRV